MRRVYVLILMAALLPGAAFAQDETLADIRQQMSILFVELQKLKRELSTTGGASVQTSGATMIDRVNTIESELSRLTGKVEELEFRIDGIVADGSNQLDDLNFRLCELEPGCDIGDLPTLTLGGDAGAATTAPSAPQSPGVQLAANEQSDFEAAETALAEGRFQEAVDQFRTFNQTYPGGPLAVAADLRRGEAHEGLGDTREAARAYLEAFRLNQTGPLAPEALYLLGRALGRLGQQNEACVMLGEVSVRFPETEAVPRAFDEMQRIGCS